MTVVRETRLPGVGVRHDFTTEAGQVIGVLARHDGRRELLVYDADDIDTCSLTTDLTQTDSQVLAEMLGASQVEQSLRAVQSDVDGLAIEWIQVSEGSPSASRSIYDGEYRRRTGASIVAVIRDGKSIPAPEPNFVIEAGDVVVAVSTQSGVAALRELLLGQS